MKNQGHKKISFKLKKYLKYIVVIIALLLTGTLSFNRFGVYTIKGNSMSSTIMEGDIVLVWKKLKDQRYYHKNEIVLFNAKFEDEILPYVKRVAGIPTDSLKVNTFELSINSLIYPHDEIYYLMSDNPLIRRREYYQYLKDQSVDCDNRDISRPEARANYSFLLIPNECYFLVGDNPYESMDSRFLGFIHEDQIIGKVIAII